MIVLVDTNVLVSAALRNRLPEQVVRFVATSDKCQWTVTPEILAEYVNVLQRPRFGLLPEVIRQWAELLELRTVLISSPASQVAVPRDPKDAPFLSAALAAEADFLVTGDRDLLQSKGVVSTRIVRVAEFADEFHIP